MNKFALFHNAPAYTASLTWRLQNRLSGVVVVNLSNFHRDAYFGSETSRRTEAQFSKNAQAVSKKDVNLDRVACVYLFKNPDDPQVFHNFRERLKELREKGDSPTWLEWEAYLG